MKHHGHKYKKDTVIFNTGDQDFRLYFVVEGEITIFKNAQIIRVIHAGEYFGERDLLMKSPRISTAIISSDWSRIISASESQIRRMLIEDHQVNNIFLSHMAKTLQSL
jgi:CRP-like cAMP-binding protein